MFWRSLLRLTFVIVLFAACAVLFTSFGISLMYAVMFCRMVISMMIIVTCVCQGSVMCGSLFSWFSWVSCASAMSHPRSGILLSGTGFLPFLVFPICSFSYSWQTFSVIGFFLDVSMMYLGCVTMVVLDLYLVLS